eukprot:107658-Chlamydomonas_euryale.AAC.1
MQPRAVVTQLVMRVHLELPVQAPQRPRDAAAPLTELNGRPVEAHGIALVRVQRVGHVLQNGHHLDAKVELCGRERGHVAEVLQAVGRLVEVVDAAVVRGALQCGGHEGVAWRRGAPSLLQHGCGQCGATSSHSQYA